MKTFFKKVPPRAFVFALLLAALLAGTEAVLGSAEERCWVENAPGGEALGNADLIPRNDKRCDKIRERGRGV